MIHLTSTLVFFALLGISLGLTIPESDIASRISGGVKAVRGQFPYTVSIQTDENDFGSFCGGSILNSRWILTAATCVISPNTTLFYVMAGTTDWKNPDGTGKRYAVIEAVVHPDNANNRAIDIALLKVNETIQFSDGIKNINLPLPKHEQPYYAVQISAWGVANMDFTETIRELHFFSARMLPKVRCVQKYPSITDKDMCILARKGYGICFKDIGSPVAFRNFQIGMATNHATCGKGPAEKILRILPFVDWIKSVINIEEEYLNKDIE